MSNWHEITLLEMVETVAEQKGMIRSEYEASSIFDNELLDYIHIKEGMEFLEVVETEFEHWMMRMVERGDIHPIQHEMYSYIGKESLYRKRQKSIWEEENE